MADDQDDSEKTEEPTYKRLEDAYQKGQIFHSREVNNFLLLLTFTFILIWGISSVLKGITAILSSFITRPELFEATGAGLGHLLLGALREIGIYMFLPILLTIVTAFGSSVIQHRLILSTEPIMPKLERISPLKGLGRMFSLRSIVEFTKGLIKITIVGVVGYIAVYPKLNALSVLHTLSIAGIMHYMLELAIRMMIGVSIAMAFIALLDYMYQRFEFMKGLRMSRHDLKEEFKQSEGNPEIKAKLKAIRAERARKRMMAAVPTADVVITNPTHFAIALKYDRATMRAPRLVAKGQDNVALKIREIAREHDIPLVRNPVLARALYDNVELEEEVPEQYYQAVADVITYVYKLKRVGV